MPEERKNYAELEATLASAPKAGTPWVHSKTGHLYWVTLAAVAEASLQPLVVYHRQSSSLMFARPLTEWEELVDVGGERVPRFRPITRDAARLLMGRDT